MPQSDSPTASIDSFKFMVALYANEDFKMVSIDICAVFLQAKILDHDVFLVPPADIRKKRKGVEVIKTLVWLR